MPVDPSYVVPPLRRGMDHDYYNYQPLDARRPVLRWPGGARVALCVIVTLEHIDWRKPPDSYQSPTLSGGYGNHPFPDITCCAHREDGHRLGLSPVPDELARHGTAA